MKKWTADELLARHDEIRDRVCERYGAQLYFLLVNVLNVSMIEGLVVSHKINRCDHGNRM